MRRTRHVVLPVKSWQYMGLMVVSLACLTLGLVSRDRGGRSESLAGPELQHTAPHEVDACPNLPPFGRVSPYDESAFAKGSNDYSNDTRTLTNVKTVGKSIVRDPKSLAVETSGVRSSMRKAERNTGRTIRSIETSRFRNVNSIRLSSDRSSRSRSREFRANTNSMYLRREMDDQTRRQRLISRSYDHRSSERRENRDTRSLSSERRSFQGRLDDIDRADRSNSVLRRVSRTSNVQDKRDDAGSSGISRSSNNRMERRTEDGRSRESRVSVERREMNQRERRQRSVANRSLNSASNIARTRSTDRAEDARLAISRQNRRFIGERKKDERQREMVRVEDSVASRSKSRGIIEQRETEVRDSSRSPRIQRSQQRLSVGYREINQRERQGRSIANRSLNPGSNAARTQSVDRADDARLEIPSQNRRFVGERNKNERQRETEVRDSSRSRRIQRSQQRLSVERREINQRERQGRSIANRSLNPGSNAARTQSVDRADDARLEIPSQNRRFVGERNKNERQRETEVRDSSRSRRIQRSQQRLSVERREINQREGRGRSIANRSVNPGSNAARTQSVDRANDARLEISQQNRRFVGERKKDERQRETEVRDSSRSPRIQRSQQRMSVERREINQREGRDRGIANRSLNPGSNAARTQSMDRANDARLEIFAQNRRFVGERKKDDGPREMVRVERSAASRSNQVRDSSRSTIFRQSSPDRIGRSDVRRTKGLSEERNSLETRKMNPLQHRTVRVDFVARSRDVQRSTSHLVNDEDFRRVAVRLGERRNEIRRVFSRSERRERTNDRSEHLHQERQRSLAERSQIRRSSAERREAIRLERRQMPSASVSTRSEERRSSGSEFRGNVERTDSPLREIRTTQARGTPTRGERSASRHIISRERQALAARSTRRQASSLDSSRRSSPNVPIFMNSQGHERSTERRLTRRIVDVSRARRAASTINDLEGTSGLANVPSLATRDRAQGRRDLTAERSYAREIRTENRRRETIIALQRSIRGLETSRKIHHKQDEPISAIGRSHEQNDVSIYRPERKITMNDRKIRVTRDENNRRIFEKRSLLNSFNNLPDFANIEKNSRINENNDYPHQILVLVICAIYGALLLKRKGGFYSFRNISNPSSRFVVW